MALLTDARIGNVAIVAKKECEFTDDMFGYGSSVMGHFVDRKTLAGD